MTRRHTQFVLMATAALVVAVLVACGLAILSRYNAERDAAKDRLRDQATFSAGVVGSAYGASVAAVAKRNAQEYGGRRVNQEALDLTVVPNRVTFAAVVDRAGRVVASSGGPGGAALQASLNRSDDVRRVLRGEPWRLSDLSDAKVALYVTAFAGADGRRALVQGFPLERLSVFLGATLAEVPGGMRGRTTLLDGGGRVVANGARGGAVGGVQPPAPAGQVSTRARVDHSAWHVQLDRPQAALYRSHPLLGWLILLLLAVAGGALLWLLRRGLRQGADLESAYAELASANRRMELVNGELSRSNAELETFAAVASHDLQEPLRKINAFGEQLERRADELSDESRDFVRRMRNASARMSVLIDDLLRFSRVSASGSATRPVDLQHVVREVLTDLEASIAEAGATVQVGRLPVVQADPTQMRQLVQNLIANALKFRREGVDPVVTVDRVPVAERGLSAFTVADNGIGFAPEHADRIFGVFERLHARDVYAGTGIGLALCRKIAQAQGGSIAAVGRPGEGATFTVVLPAATAAPAPAPADAPAPVPV